MNSKLALGFGGISLIIIFVIFLNYFPNEMGLLDQSPSNDTELITKNSPISSEYEFYIDENGTKHIIINVEDNPKLSD